jgi:hypothetical protein
VRDIASGLEHEFPRVITGFCSFEITGAHGERVVRSRAGWCVMQSRFLICGMAAVPVPGGTRLAFLAGLRFPGLRLPGRCFARPPGRSPCAPSAGWNAGSGLLAVRAPRNRAASLCG